MNKQSAIRNPRSKIAIAGAGPAGSSLAIRLAQSGFETVLIERERFPRQKLCGEFISPECLGYFEKLGVLDDMLLAGGDRIFETRFFTMAGKSITVPTDWFIKGGFALSLSRAEMDLRLLQRAKDAGANVLEHTVIVGVDRVNGSVATISARAPDGKVSDVAADIFIDATGRASVLAKLAGKQDKQRSPIPTKPAIVGFKAHLRNTDLPKGVCEIYSFQGGYAGFSNVEDDLANLCFLIDAETVRSHGSDANEIVEKVVLRNKRASAMLGNMIAPDEWLAVSIDGFGTKSPAPAANLFTVGDAASFIDPFTGSGMAMALESADILADILTRQDSSPRKIAEEYLVEYKRRFSNRLRVCSLLRRTAFMPKVASGVVSSLRFSSAACRLIARATRR